MKQVEGFKIIKILEHIESGGAPAFSMGETHFRPSFWPERIRALTDDGRIIFWNGATGAWTNEFDITGTSVHGEI